MTTTNAVKNELALRKEKLKEFVLSRDLRSIPQICSSKAYQRLLKTGSMNWAEAAFKVVLHEQRSTLGKQLFNGRCGITESMAERAIPHLAKNRQTTSGIPQRLVDAGVLREVAEVVNPYGNGKTTCTLYDWALPGDKPPEVIKVPLYLVHSPSKKRRLKDLYQYRVFIDRNKAIDYRDHLRDDLGYSATLYESERQAIFRIPPDETPEQS